MIQTYSPEHYSIVNAAKQDYESFYEEEISYRRLMGYPPAAGLMAIYASGADEALSYESFRISERFCSAGQLEKHRWQSLDQQVQA